MAAKLAAAARRPDLVLTSTARRARETTEIVTRHLAPAPERRLEDALYLAAPGEILRTIAAAEPDWSGVLVVGHNPGLGDLAADLALGGGPAARLLQVNGFPTCALAAFELDIDGWEEVDGALARLGSFEVPFNRATRR